MFGGLMRGTWKSVIGVSFYSCAWWGCYDPQRYNMPNGLWILGWGLTHHRSDQGLAQLGVVKIGHLESIY